MFTSLQRLFQVIEEKNILEFYEAVHWAMEKDRSLFSNMLNRASFYDCYITSRKRLKEKEVKE